jgi:DHA2 family multidrug resistance protein-like MFS transporter
MQAAAIAGAVLLLGAAVLASATLRRVRVRETGAEAPPTTEQTPA